MAVCHSCAWWRSLADTFWQRFMETRLQSSLLSQSSDWQLYLGTTSLHFYVEFGAAFKKIIPFVDGKDKNLKDLFFWAGLNSFMDGAPFTIQRLCEVRYISSVLLYSYSEVLDACRDHNVLSCKIITLETSKGQHLTWQFPVAGVAESSG